MTLLKIGELAELCHVSTQTLRYWDSVGILPADRVDEQSGYRYYSPERRETFRLIMLYKEIGFSLDEIRILLYDPPERYALLMASRRAELERELHRVKGKLTHLESISHEREARAEQRLDYFRDPANFQNDEALLGRWSLCGRLNAQSEVSLDAPPPPPEAPLTPIEDRTLAFPHLVCLPEGRAWWMMAWTKGSLYFMNVAYRCFTPAPYTLWERPDGRYMTLRYEHPGAMPAGGAPIWLLYRQTEHRALSERESRACVDDTALPLLPDPAVTGSWITVDFVRDPDDLLPDRPAVPSTALWILHLDIRPDNICLRRVSYDERSDIQSIIYTRTPDGPHRGALLYPAMALAEGYDLRRIDGTDYLFIQHKSGDYYYGGAEPAWYVFRRTVPS